jgi:hypothetical protein
MRKLDSLPGEADAHGSIAGSGRFLDDEADLLRGLWWPGARRSGLTTVRPR